MEENSLAKYMGKDLKGAIAKLEVIQGQARETGNTYYAIDMTFVNGYKKRFFLRSEEQFAWTNAFDVLETQVQVQL